MNVEIGAEAALFPEKEYINGIAVAVIGRYINSLPESKYSPFRDYELGYWIQSM